MKEKRILKINALLRRVISDVINNEVKDIRLVARVSVMEVDVSSDLQHAEVLFTIVGSSEEKEQTLRALQSASGFIAFLASKQVDLRYFPKLKFSLDASLEKYLHINQLLDSLGFGTSCPDFPCVAQGADEMSLKN